jgi:hypothetical protein
MILYLDTSSLVKLYLEEVQSEVVRRWAQEIEELKDELLYSPHPVANEDGRGLVWTGAAAPIPTPFPLEPATLPVIEPEKSPLSYTPQHLAEKILTSRSILEGERKQVTVLFADIKDSTEKGRTRDDNR